MRRAEFLLPPVPSFESGGRGKFIGMLLLFIACLSIFDLFAFFLFNYWKETCTCTTQILSSPKKIHSLIDPYTNIFRIIFNLQPLQ